VGNSGRRGDKTGKRGKGKRKKGGRRGGERPALFTATSSVCIILRTTWRPELSRNRRGNGKKKKRKRGGKGKGKDTGRMNLWIFSSFFPFVHGEGRMEGRGGEKKKKGYRGFFFSSQSTPEKTGPKGSEGGRERAQDKSFFERQEPVKKKGKNKLGGDALLPLPAQRRPA